MRHTGVYVPNCNTSVEDPDRMHLCALSSPGPILTPFQQTDSIFSLVDLNPNWHEVGHFPPPCPFWIRFCQLNSELMPIRVKGETPLPKESNDELSKKKFIICLCYSLGIQSYEES